MISIFRQFKERSTSRPADEEDEGTSVDAPPSGRGDTAAEPETRRRLLLEALERRMQSPPLD